eukprot:6210415-Pleurochrysis_carterae.AAC.2
MRASSSGGRVAWFQSLEREAVVRASPARRRRWRRRRSERGARRERRRAPRAAAAPGGRRERAEAACAKRAACASLKDAHFRQRRPSLVSVVAHAHTHFRSRTQRAHAHTRACANARANMGACSYTQACSREIGRSHKQNRARREDIAEKLQH